MKTGLDKKRLLEKFLMTLAATTVSIVLTFGTTAIIDRKKQKAAKREMVLMIMYDMRESLKGIEECNSNIRAFIDTQVEAVSHPKEFESYFTQLIGHIPVLEYPTTTETIFRSNVETVQTIGNVLFVECVSTFYDLRSQYKREVADDFVKDLDRYIFDYASLRDFDSDMYPFFGSAFFWRMNEQLEQCKLMMKVKDKDLDRFNMQKEKLLKTLESKDSFNKDDALLERQQLDDRLQKAREAGRKELE